MSQGPANEPGNAAGRAADRPDPWGKVPRWVRWVLRVALGLSLVLLAMALPLGCTTTIVPPARVRDPVSVFLIDFGRTPSLVLPRREGGGLVRYVYGDWQWYARGHTNLFRALMALFVPTQATLGRREMPGATASIDGVSRAVGGAEHIYEIRVERARAAALREQLNELFQRRAETEVYNDVVDLYFVHHPQSYTYFHNSNHTTAGWLRALGCETRGPAFSSKWALAQARDERAAANP